MEDSAETGAREAELDKVQRRLRKIVDLITDDDAPIKALKDELRGLERRQHDVEAHLTPAKAAEPLIHHNLAEVYRRRVADLQGAMSDPALRDEAPDLIRSLIDRVVLAAANGKPEIEIKGELAGILHLCAGARRAKPGLVSETGFAEQLNMVAGAGFEPTTFRL